MGRQICVLGLYKNDCWRPAFCIYAVISFSGNAARWQPATRYLEGLYRASTPLVMTSTISGIMDTPKTTNLTKKIEVTASHRDLTSYVNTAQRPWKIHPINSSLCPVLRRCSTLYPENMSMDFDVKTSKAGFYGVLAFGASMSTQLETEHSLSTDMVMSLYNWLLRPHSYSHDRDVRTYTDDGRRHPAQDLQRYRSSRSGLLDTRGYLRPLYLELT